MTAEDDVTAAPWIWPEHLEADQLALLGHPRERPDVGAPDEPTVDRLHRVGHDGRAPLGARSGDDARDVGAVADLVGQR